MLGDNDELTLGASFDADKMEVALRRGSDNWEKVLVVDSDGKTKVSSGEGALNPDDDWFIIIRTKNNNDGPKPPQEGPGQQTFKAKLGEGLAVDGIGKDESGIYELLEDTIIRITKEDFNSETMVIRVKSDDGFETTLRVNDDRTTSISNKTNDGGIPEPFTIEIVNRSELDPEGPEGQGPDDGNNPPQGDLDRVQADKGQIAINIKNSFCGNVEYSLGDGSGWKEFRGGFLDLTDIDSGTTIKFKAYISGDVKADIKGDETIIDIDGKIDPINKDDLRNGVFSFDFDSAKAYTIDIVFDYFGENTGSDFDGTAYIIWKGSKNQTCFYRFENLDPREDNFVNVKDIVDQSVSGSTEKFTLDAEYEWVRKEVFEENWDKEDSILKSWFASEIDEDTLHSFTMDPTTSKRGANSIFNTPDRKFRIGLITDAYQAIVIDAESMVYPECPYNDNVFGVPYVDISETEEEFFAICEVYLDEPVITLGADEISNGLKSVKAINAMDTATGL